MRIDEIANNAKYKKRPTITKLDNFLRIFVILQIFSFLNLIINKLVKF